MLRTCNKVRNRTVLIVLIVLKGFARAVEIFQLVRVPRRYRKTANGL